MKTKPLIPLLVLALVIPALSRAQTSQQPTSQKRTVKPRTVAAVVSADGKSFLDSKKGQWTVSNPEALKGYQNQRVKVKYLGTPEQNRAQILSVKPIPAFTENTAHKGDSAFHR